MSHRHHHRKRVRTRRRSKSCKRRSRKGTFESELPQSGEFPQLWAGRGCERLRHFVWRPVREFSRESRRIFEHDHRPPCPVHKRPASMTTSSCHTALNDDVITVDPEQRSKQQPMHKSLSRHSKRSKHSKHSKTRKSRGHKVLQDEEFSDVLQMHTPRSKSKSSVFSDELLSTRYSTGISVDTVEGYDYSARVISLLSFFKDFVDKYPRFAFIIGCLIFTYIFMSQLDSTLAIIFESFIRFLYPASHYVAVTNEQFFARLSRMASRSDEVMEAFYCDFARMWCERFQLMCDVHCSFVEQTLQRIRKHPQ